MVGRAYAISGGDLDRFERELTSQLKKWLITMPAGIGMATLRACLKLLAGFGPNRSGVYSAGNGPVMRAAMLGICAAPDDQLSDLVRVSTRLTHTDPRAEEGALVVARAARLAIAQDRRQPIEFLSDEAARVRGGELRTLLSAAVSALAGNRSSLEFAESCGWSTGISGYVNHTVPAALYCWAKSPTDFRQCVERAVMLGGDTDTVAAITGAICGANVGADAVPSEWTNRIVSWPRSLRWMTELARAIDDVRTRHLAAEPPPMRWLAAVPRNFAFATIVIGLGFRRLLPPY
jgi:ADP-ribosylglycohydrolase